jgi:hypothetical protein
VDGGARGGGRASAAGLPAAAGGLAAGGPASACWRAGLGGCCWPASVGSRPWPGWPCLALGGPADLCRPGLAGHPLHLVLDGASLVVGPGVPAAPRGAVVVLREALGSLLAIVVEMAGASILLAHRRAADVGQSGESLLRCRWT